MIIDQMSVFSKFQSIWLFTFQFIFKTFSSLYMWTFIRLVSIFNLNVCCASWMWTYVIYSDLWVFQTLFLQYYLITSFFIIKGINLIYEQMVGKVIQWVIYLLHEEPSLDPQNPWKVKWPVFNFSSFTVIWETETREIPEVHSLDNLSSHP